MDYPGLFLYLLVGVIIITLIDTLGAILSRKLNFKYRYLTVISLILYILIGCLASKQFNLVTAVVINGLIGLYDGTIGFWLSIKLKANNDLTVEQAAKLSGSKTAISMTGIAILLSLIGYGLTFI